MAEKKKKGGRSGRSRSIGARSRKRENAFRDLETSVREDNAQLRRRIEELEGKLNPRAMQPPRKETDA